MVATTTGPMNSIATAVPRGIRAIASKNATFIATVTTPKPAATASPRCVHCTRHGRRHSTSATAAAAQRSQATAVGSVVVNRKTPSAAPTYCETAPTTKNSGTDHAGTRDRGVMAKR